MHSPVLAPMRTSTAPVLRKNAAHGRRYGTYSETYVTEVHKWRFHFYGVIHKVFRNVGEFDFPIVFAPLETYLDGFKVEYHAISDLPQNVLADLRANDEIEEGWNFISDGEIHIFYDESTSLVRQRFTIAHEWGHVFQKLDWEFKAAMEAIPNPKERQLIIESVANHFAAYYLVPFPLLNREYFDAHDTVGNKYTPLLARRFNVSEQVITYHMLNFAKKLKR